MQANGGGEVRDREREGDSRVGGEGEEAGEDEAPARKVNDLQNSTNNFNFTKENAALASSRTEAWERLDQPMQEAATVGEESDGENLPALLASLGLRSGKFADGQYGNLELFDTGLEGYVGLPDVHVFQAMMREHASTEKFTPSNKQGIITSDKEEWEHIVTKGPDGNVVVNASDRSGKSMCQDFMEHEMTKKAGLTLEEVIALRLYTGPQFQKYNQHLRGLNAARTEKVGSRSLARSLSRSFAKRAKTERHYTTTIHAIASALKKVARVTKLPEGGKVYRGMSGVRLPEAFREPDEYGCRGGVELGFLSTSTSKEQALKYIDMRKCMPTLFEIQLGQVDRGATLRWISQFPGEEEVLLPPLSNLEVVGEPVTIIREGVEVNVCQLRVNVNLKGLTIDELQERRKTLHVSMCDNLMSKAELTVMEKAGAAGDARWDELKEAVEGAVEEGRILMERQERRSVEEFNDDSEYSKMLQEAVQVKVMVARKADALIEAGGEVGGRMRLRGVPLGAFSTVYSFWTAMAGYEGPKWERVTTTADEDEVLSLRDETGGTLLHWAASDTSRAKLAEVIATRNHGRVLDVKNKDGFTPLLLAARGGLEGVGLALLAGGADKDAKNNLGETPLRLSVGKGHEAVSLVLLKAGADTDGKDKAGCTLLLMAARWGLEAVALALLAAGADKETKNEHGDTPLLWAAQWGHEALALALLAAGADLEATNRAGETPLLRAAQRGHTAMVLALVAAGADTNVKNGNDDTLLHYAVLGGHEALALALLAGGADKDAKNNLGDTPLLLAVGNGHEAVSLALLAAGVDKESKNKAGDNALVVAAQLGLEALARALLETGADKQAKNKLGETPLHLASREGHAAVARALLAAGVDKDAQDRYGNTPLHLAALEGHEAPARELLAAGADQDANNRAGHTPLHRAQLKGHTALVALLS